MGWWVGACGMMVVCGHRDTGKNCTRPESRCRGREGCSQSQFVCAVRAMRFLVSELQSYTGCSDHVTSGAVQVTTEGPRA